MAHEHHPTYDASSPEREPAGTAIAEVDAAHDAAPAGTLGLPVLDELPELAGPLAALADASRLQVQAVLALARLLEEEDGRDRVAEVSGVGLEHWLAATGGAPRLERATWLRAAQLLLRLPALRHQVQAGAVSAGQLRGLTIALRGTPSELDGPLDRWLSDAAAHLHGIDADPDVLVDQARQAVRELTTSLDDDEQAANLERHLIIQPRLDGTGGRFSGEEDAYGLARLEAATRPARDEIDQERARADRLQAILHGAAGNGGCCCGDEPGASSDTDDSDNDDSGNDDSGTGEARGSTAVTGETSGTPGDGGSVWDLPEDELAEAFEAAPRPGLPERLRGLAENGQVQPPRVLVRAELSTLLDRDQLPTQLLVALAGGSLQLTSLAARALIDAHGAALRLIITDHGRTVGVGRRTNKPTGWLADAIHAVHDTCTEPLCRRPALRADLDHATPWSPSPGQSAGGRTDADNLGPLCTRPNRHGRAGWHPTQHPDGTRTWRHPRTGLTITSVPASWRPPTHHPRPPERDDGGGTDPPRNGPPSGSDEPVDDVPF